jgi:hypothetical protein
MLTGLSPSPADRTIVGGVPLRVVELTGEPGDVVFCQPVMVHCVGPNRGQRPRFMRIKTEMLTREGRELRDRPEAAGQAPLTSSRAAAGPTTTS